MRNVDGLEQHSNLINELKTRTSCRALKTNCFLSPGEISAYISQQNWKYVDLPEELYFFHTDGMTEHLYYYAAADAAPKFQDDFELPVMADFVLREREITSFENEIMPLWEEAGFAFYKKYQRMRCVFSGNISGSPDGVADGYAIGLAEPAQAEEIRKLWGMYLDKYDIVLPSMDETIKQIQEGNVVCCMEQGRVCGAIYVEVNGRSGLVQHVTVHKDYRRKALGERMIRYLCGYMPQKGVTDFKLWVDVENLTAIKLYKKSGFKQDGIFSVKLMKGELK